MWHGENVTLQPHVMMINVLSIDQHTAQNACCDDSVGS
jgi:hypothetical protein